MPPNSKLKIWKPNIDSKDIFMLGHLPLLNDCDPNMNIPMLLLKNGTDDKAIASPAKFCFYSVFKNNAVQNIYSFKIANETKYLRENNGKFEEIYCYCLQIIPPKGYSSLGAIFYEQSLCPIPIYDKNYLQQYLTFHKLENITQIACIKTEYLDFTFESRRALVKVLLESEMYKYRLYLAKEMQVSCIPRMVHLSCFLEVMTDEWSGPTFTRHRSGQVYKQPDGHLSVFNEITSTTNSSGDEYFSGDDEHIVEQGYQPSFDSDLLLSISLDTRQLPCIFCHSLFDRFCVQVK